MGRNHRLLNDNSLWGTFVFIRHWHQITFLYTYCWRNRSQASLVRRNGAPASRAWCPRALCAFHSFDVGVYEQKSDDEVCCNFQDDVIDDVTLWNDTAGHSWRSPFKRNERCTRQCNLKLNYVEARRIITCLRLLSQKRSPLNSGRDSQRSTGTAQSISKTPRFYNAYSDNNY